MKTLFPGDYHPIVQFADVLPHALIVFDTNVLINFYEWGPTTRKNSFATLRKVQLRCWLPYHVALEFHRNRTGRVEHALKKHKAAITRISTGISDIAKSVNEQDFLKMHPNTEDCIKTLKDAGDALAAHAEEAMQELPKRSSEDAVKGFLAELFDGRIGAYPSQKDVETINAEGKKRYESKHPPGVTDSKKDGLKFMDRGVVYDGMYGDLYIWKQILEYLPTQTDKKHLIFVTDERKKDWWSMDDETPPNPAPELVRELAHAAEGWSLSMYRSPEFFEHLSSALGTELSAEDLAQIKHASASSDSQVSRQRTTLRDGISGESAPLALPRRFQPYLEWITQELDVAADNYFVKYMLGGIEITVFNRDGLHHYWLMNMPSHSFFSYAALENSLNQVQEFWIEKSYTVLIDVVFERHDDISTFIDRILRKNSPLFDKLAFPRIKNLFAGTVLDNSGFMIIRVD